LEWQRTHLKANLLFKTPQHFSKMLVSTGIYEGETILFPLIAGKHLEAIEKLLRLQKDRQSRQPEGNSTETKKPFPRCLLASRSSIFLYPSCLIVLLSPALNPRWPKMLCAVSFSRQYRGFSSIQCTGVHSHRFRFGKDGCTTSWCGFETSTWRRAPSNPTLDSTYFRLLSGVCGPASFFHRVGTQAAGALHSALDLPHV
jgi:hypothetical protein